MAGGGLGGAGMGGGGGAPPINLYFSEYYEGTATPQQSAVEIFNAGTGDVSLIQCLLRINVNGAQNFTTLLLPLATLQPNQVWVVCSSGFSANCDTINSMMAMVTGDDAVSLVCGADVQDVIGQTGFDPGTEWGMGLTSTADNVMRRNCTVTDGDNIGNDVFNPVFDWTGAFVSTNDLGTRICTTSR